MEDDNSWINVEWMEHLKHQILPKSKFIAKETQKTLRSWYSL